MHKIRLETLGLEVDVPDGTAYHDLGYVDDPVESYRQLIKERGIKDESASHPPFCFSSLPLSIRDIIIPRLGGLFFVIQSRSNPEARELFVCTRNVYGRGMRVFCRAHEETHALHYMGKLSCLEAVLRRRRTTRQPLCEKNEEAIADIGGFYALQSPHNHVDMIGQMATYLICSLNFVAITNAYRARS